MYRYIDIDIRVEYLVTTPCHQQWLLRLIPVQSTPSTAGSCRCSWPTPRGSRRGIHGGTVAPRCKAALAGAAPGRSRTPPSRTACHPERRMGSTAAAAARCTGGAAACPVKAASVLASNAASALAANACHSAHARATLCSADSAG